jgi:hypothetical protein
MLLTRNSKVLLTAALGVALLIPQSKADQPKDNPPAPMKTAKDTVKTVKDTKKVTKGTNKKVVWTTKNKVKDRTIDNRFVAPGPSR